jgi:hypothetical protein
MRRVLLALLLLALTAPAADAKYVFVDLRARTFTPGELIESQLYGCTAACGVEVRGMPAVLIRAGTRFNDRCDVPRYAAGRLTRSGSLHFLMPELRTGWYQIMIRLFQEAHNGCRWTFASNPFRVVGT